MKTEVLDQSGWHRGRELLGVEYGIMCGAMTWVSERNLVSAISNYGGFGTLACGAMSPDILKEEILATRQLTDKPFGVNLIVMHPLLKDLVEVCIETGVRHVVVAGGLPRKEIIQRLIDGGVRVLGLAPTVPIAKKLISYGICGLIIEGSEAGGHIGSVSTSVLAQEILPAITSVPVFVAGGIGCGEAIGMYLRMGASGVQIGTRFVCAEESIAHANFKNAFIRAKSRDAVLSAQLDHRFPVIPVRSLANDGIKKFTQLQAQVLEKFISGHISQKEGQLEIEHFWAGALRRAVIEGDTISGSLMAGQSVGMVKAIEPIQDIMYSLIVRAEKFLSP